MGRPILVNMVANVRDFTKGMREAATSAQTAAKDVGRAGQDMGKGLTTGTTPALTGFRAQFRGVGPLLRQTGKDAGGQFSQAFGQGLVSSGGNPLQAFRSALSSTLPFLGAAGIGAAIGVELVTGYLAQLDKRRAELAEAGRKLVQAQAAGMVEASQAWDYLVTITGTTNMGEAGVALGKAAESAGVSVDQLTSAILTGGDQLTTMLDDLTVGSRYGEKVTGAARSGAEAAVGLLKDAAKARNDGTKAAKTQSSVDAAILATEARRAAEGKKTADAAERAAAAARGQVLPMSAAEASAARMTQAVRDNRREMSENRVQAERLARALADGKVTADEYRPIQAFSGENLADALAVMDRWDNLQNKRMVLDIMVSYEDARRIFSNGGAGVEIP